MTSGVEGPDMDSLLIYGAYGYTGELIARRLSTRDDRPVLAGRDATSVYQLGEELDCESRSFDLSDPERIEKGIEDVDAVLNCAGPFDDTADPLAEACLRTGTHYLDITGEVPVFERLARLDDRARDAGVVLMPGVGFDVVPTDCLAAHLHDRLPEATHLAIAIAASGTLSAGTTKTALRGAGQGGAIRADGVLRAVPAADRTRTVDFGWGVRTVTSVPMGDVATAYRTTGIPNVRVYVRVPRAARIAMRLADRFDRVLQHQPVQELLERLVDRAVDGPDENERRESRVTIWGEARREDTNERVVTLLSTPGPYALTVDASIACTDRVLDGEVEPGFRTPGGAFGPEFALDLPGVSRTDRN